MDAEPVRISGKDVPLPYAENLEKNALPQIDEIIHKTKEICYMKEKIGYFYASSYFNASLITYYDRRKCC